MAEQESRASGGQTADHKKKFAVLVDGFAKDLFTTGITLQRLDYEVYIVNTGEDALKIVNAALPALIITELSLPQMSGLELLVRIKHDPDLKSLPVIVHTALEDQKKKELCVASGCAAFLKKPADPGTLYTAIQEATEDIPRQFIRVRTLMPVLVGGLPPAAGSNTTEYITELSEAGVFVRTLYPRPVNAVLPVTLIIRSIPIKLKALVVHSVVLTPGLFREPGMGMKFIEISTTDREVIRNIIKGQILKDIPGS